MTITAIHLVAIWYLEVRGGRALTADCHFSASILNDLHDAGLVQCLGYWGEGAPSHWDGHADVVVLRYGYRAKLRELLADQRQEDDREGK